MKSTATLVTNCKEVQKHIIGKIGEDELALAGEIVQEKVKIQDTIRSIFTGKNAKELLLVNHQLNQRLERFLTREKQFLQTLDKGKKLCCS